MSSPTVGGSSPWALWRGWRWRCLLRWRLDASSHDETGRCSVVTEQANDFVVLIGDTFWAPQEWALAVDGQPVDLANGPWVVRAQVRRRPTDSVITYDFSPDGLVIGSATLQVGDTEIVTSTVRLHIPAATTAGFGEWRGVWDVELSHPTLDVNGGLWRRTIRSGTIRTIQDVTR